MNDLPSHLAEEILFKMDLKSLAKMQCTGKSLHSHISDDPYFKVEYFSRGGSSLLHISSQGSNFISYLSFFGSIPKTIETLKMECQILGSCSGLLLLFVHGLYVANPYTNKFRFLDHSRSRLFPRVTGRKVVDWNRTMYIGFAVDQINRATQRFKIVCINDRRGPNQDETIYQFEINTGDSWRLSETTIICHSNDLDKRIKPVYSHGSLNWFRNDGSIIAFNPETEQACLIPIKIPKELSLKTFFANDNNELTLILAADDVIYIYALKNILVDPKWVLARRIMNIFVEKKKQIYWNVVAYDGKFLMLWEKTEDRFDGVVHRYNLGAMKWEVMGLIPGWYDTNRDFYQFKPSFSSVIGLDKKVKTCDDKCLSSLSLIMGLIV